ncbi:MAG: hypothetical protein RB191_11530 [Terriglobia bacterium]|nr:hypothetical protein [Terriglobia bacterium]
MSAEPAELKPAQELVAKADILPMPTNQPPTLLAYLRAAETGADLDRLEKLMDLHERWEDRQARNAFTLAMSKFKSEVMQVWKTKHVDVPGGAKFNHAQLADYCDAAIPNLSKYGLRHRWKTQQDTTVTPMRITVTCIISHELGGDEETPLFGPPDTLGNKSPLHAIASTVALLERYTFAAATGLAAREMDANPKGTGVADPETTGPKAPDDYANWKADARAIADEGSPRLQDLWSKTPADIRRFVVSSDGAWWADMKKLAAKASKAAS